MTDFTWKGELALTKAVRQVQRCSAAYIVRAYVKTEEKAETMEQAQYRYLQFVLVVIGLVFLSLYPLMKLWPSGWVWLPIQSEYEQMMIGVYGTLGIFLIRASHRPAVHLSLIWFTFWSSLIHGIIMGTQAMIDPAERGHLIGDVAALFVVVVLLGWLTPRASVKEQPNVEFTEHT